MIVIANVPQAIAILAEARVRERLGEETKDAQEVAIAFIEATAQRRKEQSQCPTISPNC